MEQMEILDYVRMVQIRTRKVRIEYINAQNRIYEDSLRVERVRDLLRYAKGDIGKSFLLDTWGYRDPEEEIRKVVEGYDIGLTVWPDDWMAKRTPEIPGGCLYPIGLYGSLEDLQHPSFKEISIDGWTIDEGMRMFFRQREYDALWGEHLLEERCGCFGIQNQESLRILRALLRMAF